MANEQQTQQGQAGQQQAQGQQAGQQSQESIVSQVQGIKPRNPNEIDLSRLSAREGEEEQEQQQGGQQAQQQQQQAAQPAQAPDLRELMRTHPELAQLAQKAQMADQLRGQLDSFRPFLPDIQKMMEQRKQEARQRGDMTGDFNRVFGDEYGAQVQNLLKAFVENMVPQQLQPFEQRLGGVENLGREVKINNTCDEWYNKLSTALKDDDTAKGVIQHVLSGLQARKPNFTADDVNSAIALEVSNFLIQNPGQGAAPAGQQAAGVAQQGPNVPSTQAAQRMVPSAAEAQRRTDGALESGQPQGGPQLGAGDMQQQEADRIFDEYRDWG